MDNRKSDVEYQELVLPGISYFAIGLLIALGTCLVALPFGETLAIFVGIATLALWIGLAFMTAKRVLISKSHLQVGKAIIERKYLGTAMSLSKEESRNATGPDLSSLAFLKIQFGVPSMVKVQVIDESDPTPYWLFSTRQPDVVEQYLSKTN